MNKFRKLILRIHGSVLILAGTASSIISTIKGFPKLELIAGFSTEKNVVDQFEFLLVSSCLFGYGGPIITAKTQRR